MFSFPLHGLTARFLHERKEKLYMPNPSILQKTTGGAGGTAVTNLAYEGSADYVSIYPLCNPIDINKQLTLAILL